MNPIQVTVVFLLGAGASRKAGVPLVGEFIREFRATLNAKDQTIVEGLVKRLQPSGAGGVVDVELLLDALEKVQNLASDPIAALVGKNTVDIATTTELAHLSDALKRYIRKRCSQDITPDTVRYLTPILDFARTSGTLDIFSLNYDMCIEMVAEDQRMRYTDGFDLVWAPERLDETGTVEAPLVRIYKIHGSVVWYRRSDFRYVKIPLLPTEEPIRYFTHEPVLEMMLYPALTKAGVARPYQELLHRFRTVLGSATMLVVIGYSFRDEPIRALIQEASTGNAALTVFLVGPDAEATRDAVFSDSGLDTRAIALNETAEAALPGGRLFNHVQDLSNIVLLRQQAESSKPQNFVSSKQLIQAAILRYISLGHLSHAKVLAEREEASNPMKATARHLHPLPRLDLCVAFAAAEGANPVWWSLVSSLVYWWEVVVANQASQGFANASVHFAARPGLAQFALESVSPSDQEIAGIRAFLRTHARDDPASRDHRTLFFAQLGLMADLPEAMRRASVANQAHSPMEQARMMLRDYMANRGASELAADLNEL